MVIFSDCKINIGLNILRRRPDGYHDIETCMVRVPWHDVVEILPGHGPASTLTVLGNKVDCPPEKNLVMKAHDRLRDHWLARGGEWPAVDIVLQKNIPDGAGLGGGSADAAHTLTGLNRLLGLGLDTAALAGIGAGIGADCPFFVHSSQAMMAEGIGEILTPVEVDLRGCTIVIAKPRGVSISTREAYAGVTIREPETPLRQLLELPVEEWQGRVKNDFEESIFRIAPQVGELKEAMLRSGAVYSSMSGSGASVYGIYRDDKMAEAALEGWRDMPHIIYRVD